MNLELALNHLKRLDLPSVETELKHSFYPGVYMRQLFIPSGSFIIGKYHKKPMLNILSFGKIAVLVEGEIKLLEAPYMFKGRVGRKAGYALEDTVWVNVIETDLTDLEEIESEFIEEDLSCLGELSLSGELRLLEA